MKEPRSINPSLPEYKLRQIIDWMAEDVDKELNLDELAEKAALSKFYFDLLNSAYSLFLDDLFARASTFSAVYRRLDTFSQKLFNRWAERVD